MSKCCLTNHQQTNTRETVTSWANALDKCISGKVRFSVITEAFNQSRVSSKIRLPEIQIKRHYSSPQREATNLKFGVRENAARENVASPRRQDKQRLRHQTKKEKVFSNEQESAFFWKTKKVDRKKQLELDDSGGKERIF